MREPATCDQYPAHIILIANLLPLLMYAIGLFLLYDLWPILTLPYLLFILFLEYRLLALHCPDCYYHGKACAFGKGRLSALLFRKGWPENFCAKEITWKDIVPDFLVFIVPVIAGVALLLRAFSTLILALVLALLLLGFAGNALVRGQLACKYCRQREIGCPAQKLFGKKTP